MSHGNRWSIVLSTWLLCSSPVAARNFENGNQLLQYCTNQDTTSFFCLGYTSAVADALDGNRVNGYDACIPLSVNVGQIKDIVVQYLRLNPAERHLAAAGLVADAISKAFPCRRQ
jgi:hypothetical protein